MESLELFAREVMPEFKDRDERHVAAKRDRLARAVDAGLARRVDDAPALPEGYTITPAIRKAIENRAGSEAIERFQQAQATGGMDNVMELASRRRG
jgi:hypothetical protein